MAESRHYFSFWTLDAVLILRIETRKLISLLKTRSLQLSAIPIHISNSSNLSPILNSSSETLRLEKELRANFLNNRFVLVGSVDEAEADIALTTENTVTDATAVAPMASIKIPVISASVTSEVRPRGRHLETFFKHEVS